MPELAEVAFYANRWQPALGEEIEDVLVRAEKRIFRGWDASKLSGALAGRQLDSIQTHGKQMLFGFSGGQWLHLHLGMSGKLLARERGSERERHDHLVFATPTQELVFSDYRMFGRVLHEEAEGLPESWTALPPEPLSKTFTKERLGANLARRPRSLLKPLLLDQGIFPGIGNWMADEICWRCHLHPTTLVGELGERGMDSVWKECRHVSRRAMEVIAPDWATPPESWLFNHRWRDGGTCPRPSCGTPLLREKIRGRTACWCPSCQRI